MARSRTQFAILALLRIQPMSGYAVREFCRNRLRHFWNESYGQIYPTLTRLAAEGLVRTVAPEAVTKSRATLYELTDTGRAALVQWLREPPAARIVRDEFLLKLFCGGESPAAVLEAHVATVRQQVREQLEVMAEANEELDALAKDHPDYPYWQLVGRSGQLALEARLQWCAEVETMLQGRK